MFAPRPIAACLALSVFVLLSACNSEGSEPFNNDAIDTTNPQPDVAPDTKQPSVCHPESACLDYKYIRIDDLSDHLTGEDPGADIDAIVLVKDGNRRIFANEARHYAAELSVHANNPDESLGAPDGFQDYPDDVGPCSYYKDLADCESGGACEPTHVSLGGPGGYLIVSVPESIEAGDQIQVLELGSCRFNCTSPDTTPSCNTKQDAIGISVSFSDDPDGTWMIVSESGMGPVISATVPQLPVVLAN